MFLSSDISLHYLRSFSTPVTPYSVSISLSSLTLAPSDLQPPTSVLHTPAYSHQAWTSDLRPLGPPQIEGTDGVSECWSNNFTEALARVRRTPDRNSGTPDSARHSPNMLSLIYMLRLILRILQREAAYG